MDLLHGLGNRLLGLGYHTPFLVCGARDMQARGLMCFFSVTSSMYALFCCLLGGLWGVQVEAELKQSASIDKASVYDFCIVIPQYVGLARNYPDLGTLRGAVRSLGNEIAKNGVPEVCHFFHSQSSTLNFCRPCILGHWCFLGARRLYLLWRPHSHSTRSRSCSPATVLSPRYVPQYAVALLSLAQIGSSATFPRLAHA